MCSDRISTTKWYLTLSSTTVTSVWDLLINSNIRKCWDTQPSQLKVTNTLKVIKHLDCLLPAGVTRSIWDVGGKKTEEKKSSAAAAAAKKRKIIFTFWDFSIILLLLRMLISPLNIYWNETVWDICDRKPRPEPGLTSSSLIYPVL